MPRPTSLLLYAKNDPKERQKGARGRWGAQGKCNTSRVAVVNRMVIRSLSHGPTQNYQVVVEAITDLAVIGRSLLIDGMVVEARVVDAPRDMSTIATLRREGSSQHWIPMTIAFCGCDLPRFECSRPRSLIHSTFLTTESSEHG